MLPESEDGFGTGDVVDEEDEIALLDLLAEVAAGGGVDEFGEDVLGVGAHVGRQHHLLVRFGHLGGQVGDDGADEGSLPDAF
jgi:hypothetical protein